MAILKRRKKSRLCRNCRIVLPPSNWIYCDICKKLLFEDKEEDFPSSTYKSIIDIDHLDLL
jgi:hypothetical protein